MKIKNSVVVVTGASAGIGAAIVKRLAKKGANVVVTARRQERLDTLVNDLARHKGERMALAGDIRDEAFCKELIAQTVERFGRIDVLINNAGLGHNSLLEELDSEHMQTIADTNVGGLLFGCQAAIPYMKAQGKGQLINISSIVGQCPVPYLGFYTASKTAVNFISRTFRMELRKSGITVTSVYPGMTKTDFHAVKLGEGGKRHGRGVSADRVAKKVVRAIKKQKREVYITLYDWAFTHANRLFPRTFDFFIGRIVLRTKV